MKRFQSLILSCVISVITVFAQCPIEVKWCLIDNQPQDKTLFKFVITNVSDCNLNNEWSFYFNQFPSPLSVVESNGLEISTINNNNYIKVKPGKEYKEITPGDHVTIILQNEETAFRGISDVPRGGHFSSETTPDAIPCPIKFDTNIKRNQSSFGTHPEYPSGEYMYNVNALVNPNNFSFSRNAFDIFPTPKIVTLNNEIVQLPKTVKVEFPSQATKVADYLLYRLRKNNISSAESQFKIQINIDETLGKTENIEYYCLDVAKDLIKITGASEMGALNGVKTLMAALDRSKNHSLPSCHITDFPDINSRGMMLDIARNWITIAEIKRLIDIFAEYKINTIQFHLADDEAWRVEIPQLPELTQVGARRGLTFNETVDGYLMQVYNGSGNPNDTHCNGYINRDEFVNLLKYAADRGINIIPEIETPGHARAAIVAMKYRYQKYASAGNLIEAEKYKLWDNDDASQYESAQGFHDNVLCISNDGVYNFLSAVFSGLKGMYAEAGLNLETIHIGGDEVAGGCWVESPAISSFMKQHNLSSLQQVREYFVLRVADLAKQYGMKIEGWQEIVENGSLEFKKQLIPNLAGINAWWTSTPEHELTTNQHAIDAIPLIISNVDHLYFDLVYRRHQLEEGLSWGGSVNEFAAWEMSPLSKYDGKVVSMRGHLWGETLYCDSQCERYLFPKSFGLIERSWNAKQTWSDDKTKSLDRVKFNLRIGEIELPYLNSRGYDFHIDQPGIIRDNGKIKVNAPYPNAKVIITENSNKAVKAKTLYLGKESVESVIE